MVNRQKLPLNLPVELIYGVHTNRSYFEIRVLPPLIPPLLVPRLRLGMHSLSLWLNVLTRDGASSQPFPYRAWERENERTTGNQAFFDFCVHRSYYHQGARCSHYPWKNMGFKIDVVYITLRNIKFN